MRLLLDTHTLIWALSEPGRLSPAARALIEDSANEVFTSAASAWEIAIKAGLGKIDFPLEDLSREMEAAGFIELPVSIRHAILVRGLPQYHRDPFDRLLVAQAIAEQVVLVSRDPALHAYPVPIRW